MGGGGVHKDNVEGLEGPMGGGGYVHKDNVEGI